eukprot:9479154-Karenia_brevis.AAC.1
MAALTLITFDLKSAPYQPQSPCHTLAEMAALTLITCDLKSGQGRTNPRARVAHSLRWLH